MVNDGLLIVVSSLLHITTFMLFATNPALVAQVFANERKGVFDSKVIGSEGGEVDWVREWAS